MGDCTRRYISEMGSQIKDNNMTPFFHMGMMITWQGSWTNISCLRHLCYNFLGRDFSQGPILKVVLHSCLPKEGWAIMLISCMFFSIDLVLIENPHHLLSVKNLPWCGGFEEFLYRWASRNTATQQAPPNYRLTLIFTLPALISGNQVGKKIHCVHD